MANELDFRRLFEESPEVLLVLLPDALRYTMVAQRRPSSPAPDGGG